MQLVYIVHDINCTLIIQESSLDYYTIALTLCLMAIICTSIPHEVRNE